MRIAMLTIVSSFASNPEEGKIFETMVAVNDVEEAMVSKDLPSSHDEAISTSWVWWGSMVLIAIFNCVFFACVCHNQKPSDDPETRRYQAACKWLAVPFVFECAYRSVFPSTYNARDTFFDTPFNCVFLDRSLAAVGEVCWIIQFAIILCHIRKQVNACKCVDFFACLMVLFAVGGEVCSDTGTFTTNCIFEVFEATQWALLMFIGGITAGYLLCKSCHIPWAQGKSAKVFLSLMFLQTFIYVPYMVISNIPMYYHRYQKDQAAHKHYLGLWDGFLDSIETRHPTRQWKGMWENEWLWMSAYFSFAVWSSIFSIYAPRFTGRANQVYPHGNPVYQEYPQATAGITLV